MLIRDIADEVGYFYHLRQIEDAKMFRWAEIETITDNLADMQHQGTRAAWRRITKSPRLTTEGFVRLARYESEEILQKSSDEQNYSDLYTMGRPPCFKRHIDMLRERPFAPPTGAAMRILELSEARRVKRVDTIVLLISSALGGVIGSLLTLWVSN